MITAPIAPPRVKNTYELPRVENTDSIIKPLTIPSVKWKQPLKQHNSTPNKPDYFIGDNKDLEYHAAVLSADKDLISKWKPTSNIMC